MFLLAYNMLIEVFYPPLDLATPDETIDQQVDNAVRYWNTHSAYKISQMVPYVAGQNPEQK